jgi:hypothetical protein
MFRGQQRRPVFLGRLLRPRQRFRFCTAVVYGIMFRVRILGPGIINYNLTCVIKQHCIKRQDYIASAEDE